MRALWWISFFCVVSMIARAQAVELDRLSIDYKKYVGYTMFSELPEANSIKEYLGFNFDVELFHKMMWRNTVHSYSTDSQFRWVGWHFELGYQLFPSLEIVGWEHHSQHCLDCTVPYDHFPVANNIGLHWTIYQR
jgi:hypothetical protein